MRGWILEFLKHLGLTTPKQGIHVFTGWKKKEADFMAGWRPKAQGYCICSVTQILSLLPCQVRMALTLSSWPFLSLFYFPPIYGPNWKRKGILNIQPIRVPHLSICLCTFRSVAQPKTQLLKARGDEGQQEHHRGTC